jgi:hypothetical protein
MKSAFPCTAEARWGQRPDGRDECEERPGAPPPNQSRVNDENVMTVFFVRAQETGNEIR